VEDNEMGNQDGYYVKKTDNPSINVVLKPNKKYKPSGEMKLKQEGK